MIPIYTMCIHKLYLWNTMQQALKKKNDEWIQKCFEEIAVCSVPSSPINCTSALLPMHFHTHTHTPQQTVWRLSYFNTYITIYCDRIANLLQNHTDGKRSNGVFILIEQHWTDVSDSFLKLPCNWNEIAIDRQNNYSMYLGLSSLFSTTIYYFPMRCAYSVHACVCVCVFTFINYSTLMTLAIL